MSVAKRNTPLCQPHGVIKCHRVKVTRCPMLMSFVVVCLTQGKGILTMNIAPYVDPKIPAKLKFLDSGTCRSDRQVDRPELRGIERLYLKMCL